MKYKELLEKRGSYAVEEATPHGVISNEDQYNYLMDFCKYTGMTWYFADADRHIPTYDECKGRCLRMIDFFGGAAFYFTLNNTGDSWSDGVYGRIDFSEEKKCR